MRSFLFWLAKHRAIHLLVCIGYYLLVVLPHEQFGKWIYNHLFSGDIDQYNLRFLVLITLASTAFFYPLYRNLFRNPPNVVDGREKLPGWRNDPAEDKLPDRTVTIGYLLFTCSLMIAAYFTIFVLATELVHFPQYAVMAMLLFPLTWRYTDTLFWATLLGALDEAYQYFYLAPLRTDYYDFNDVVINFLGAALGLVFLRSFHPAFPQVEARPVWRSPPFWAGLAILTAAGLCIQLNWLAVYPSGEDDPQGLLLVRKVPENFWSDFHHLHYHVVLPEEGVLLLLLLFLLYSGIGKFRKNHQFTSPING